MHRKQQENIVTYKLSVSLSASPLYKKKFNVKIRNSYQRHCRHVFLSFSVQFG